MQIQNSVTNKDKHFLISFIALDKVLMDSLFHLITPCFFPIRSKFTLMNCSHREVTFQFLFYTNFSFLVSASISELVSPALSVHYPLRFKKVGLDCCPLNQAFTVSPLVLVSFS